MEAHWFEQGPVALGICKQCGREKNDYQYHFVAQTNAKWSEPSPSEQAGRGIMSTEIDKYCERILDLEVENKRIHARYEELLSDLHALNERLRARIDNLEADKGWLREQMTRPRP